MSANIAPIWPQGATQRRHPEDHGIPVARQPALMPSNRMHCLFGFIVIAVCLLANTAHSAVVADHPNIIYNGALDYFTHDRDGGHDWHRDDKECRDDGYATLLLGTEAVRVIGQAPPERPFFLYVPFNAPHTPLQAPGEYLKRYAHITDQKRQAFAAMVKCLDDQVGRVVTALEQRGLAKSTLILFSSDNGGLPGVGGATNGKLRGRKGTLYEGGTRVPAFANWPGHIKPGTVINEPLHIVDWFPTLVNLAGGSLKQDHPLDGRDIWPVITAGKPSPHEDILINAMPNSGAIRMGAWKLVVNGAITANDLENASLQQKTPRSKHPTWIVWQRRGSDWIATMSHRSVHPRAWPC